MKESSSASGDSDGHPTSAHGNADNNLPANSMQRSQETDVNTTSSRPGGGDHHPWMDVYRSSHDSGGGEGDGIGEQLLRRFKRLRVMCGRFVNSSRVQLAVVILIAVNAVVMGIGTFDFVTEDPIVEARFLKVDLAFLIVFTVELSLQFVYHGLRLLLDRWLLFDLVIIVSSWSFKEAQIMRAFRIFRALRLITRIDTMRNLVNALFTASSSMVGIGLLLFLVMYIFSVMFTQLFKTLYKDGHTTYNYFSSLDASFFTCFQFMTFDNWGDVCKDVQSVYWWAWMPIVCYILIAGFAIVNLIVAVICDAMAALHDDERAKITGRPLDASKYDEAEEYKEERNEGEEMKEEERECDQDSSAIDSWEAGEGASKNSSSMCSIADINMHLLKVQGEVGKTLQVQDQTMSAIDYLARELAELPTPDQ